MIRRSKAFFALMLLFVLPLAACGDDGDEAAASGDSPTTTAAASDKGLAQLEEKAKAEGSVVVYSDQSNERMEALKTAFAEEHPGIQLEFFRADSTAILERIPTEYRAGQFNYDVLMTTERTFERLVADEPTAAKPYKAVNAEAIPADFQVPDGRFQSFGVNYTGVAYNTTCTKELDSYDDLLDPKWKGKISMQDPLSGGGSESWVHAMYDAMGEAKWREFMTKLKAQNIKYDTYVPAQNTMASGETCILVAAYPDFVEPLKAQGAPVEWAAVEPMSILRYSVNLAGKPTHENAGKLFIEFLLSEKGQRTLAKSGLTVAATEYNLPAFKRLEDIETVQNPFRRLLQDPDKWKAVLQSVWG